MFMIALFAQPAPVTHAAFEPGVLYENNALFADVRSGRSEWSLVDVHSGLYMFGTRRKIASR